MKGAAKRLGCSSNEREPRHAGAPAPLQLAISADDRYPWPPSPKAGRKNANEPGFLLAPLFTLMLMRVRQDRNHPALGPGCIRRRLKVDFLDREARSRPPIHKEGRDRRKRSRPGRARRRCAKAESRSVVGSTQSYQQPAPESIPSGRSPRDAEWRHRKRENGTLERSEGRHDSDVPSPKCERPRRAERSR